MSAMIEFLLNIYSFVKCLFINRFLLCTYTLDKVITEVVRGDDEDLEVDEGGDGQHGEGRPGQVHYPEN